MKSKHNLITAIDIGTTKIVCLIAIIDNTDNLKIIGYGHNISNGFKAGSITDVRLAEASLITAIEEAEKMAGVNIDRVIININGNKIESSIIDSSISLSNRPINDKDIERLINQVIEQFNNQTHELVNYFPSQYTIDNEQPIKDPRLMFGNILSCKLHLITVSSNILLNLANCFARCHIDTQDFILSPYASALSCLIKDEMDLGAVIIDIGGATTSIAVFYKGNMIHSGVIMIGGNHITSDIAHGLSINIHDAERIKILHGNVINTAFNGHEIIDLPSHEENENEISYIRSSELTEIIRPRAEEILELIKQYFKDMKINKVLTKKIILTGGVSQLAGMKELASYIFANNVRIATPKYLQGLPNTYHTPAFSVVVGILLYAHNKFLQEKYRVKEKESKRFSSLKKLFSWF